MRVAIVFFGGTKRDNVLAVSRGLSDGITERGHTVDLIDGERDSEARLSSYSYVAVGTTSVSLFRGKIPPHVTEFLSQCGMVSGRKSFAFVTKSFFGSLRALSRLMRAMEHEGMFVRFSEVLRSAVEAKAVASRLKIDG